VFKLYRRDIKEAQSVLIVNAFRSIMTSDGFSYNTNSFLAEADSSQQIWEYYEGRATRHV